MPQWWSGPASACRARKTDEIMLTAAAISVAACLRAGELLVRLGKKAERGGLCLPQGDPTY
jgi:hypothetical protein